MLDYYQTPRNYWKTTWIPLLFLAAGAYVTFSSDHYPLRPLDLWLSQLLNGLVGVSAIWDSFLALLNSKATEIVGSLFFVVIYIFFAWNDRYSDLGRLLGYIVWVASGIIVALALTYWLSERLESELDIRGPRYELADFKDLNDTFSAWEIDVSDKDSMPSRHASICFAFFWMALFRSTSLGLALLLPTLLLSLGAALVGAEWPSSVLASIFLSGFVASLLTRTPLAGIPRWLDRASMHWVEHALTFWCPSLPWKGKDKAVSPAPLTSHIVVKKNGRDVEPGVFENLIHRNILPALGISPDAHITIQFSPAGNGKIRSRYVRFVTGENIDGCIVVRGAWQKYSLVRRIARMAKLKNGADVHQILQARGIPTPRFYAQCHRKSAFGLSFYLSAESYIEGRHLQVGSLDDCILAAGCLAQMHGIERIDAGGVQERRIPRDRYSHRAVLPRVRRYVSLIDNKMPTSRVGFLGADTAQWFWRRTVEILQTGALFSLCHNDISPKNILIQGNKACMLDFTESNFGFPGLDIAEALVDWAGENAEAAGALAKAYCDLAPERWNSFREGFDYYVAMTALENLYYHLQTDGKIGRAHV